jgi:hypothetical protein
MGVSNSHDLDKVILHSLYFKQKDEVVFLGLVGVLVVFEHFLVEVGLDVLLELGDLNVVDECEEFGDYW